MAKPLVNLTLKQVVRGKTILGFVYRLSVHNRKIRFVEMICDCKRRMELPYNIVAAATRNGRLRLCCDDCRQDENAYKEPEVVQPEPDHLKGARGTKLTSETLAAIGSLKPKQLAIVKQAVHAHITACLQSKTPIESLNRVWLEAVELAKMGDKLPATEWTLENRWDGLQLQCYDQYNGESRHNFN